MNDILTKSLWQQFGASIDMLKNAIVACPDEHWDTKDDFWYLAYHTLFFLDYYLCLDANTFAPPAPFTLSEFEESERPPRTYSKEELISYLEYCKNKCYSLITEMTEETAFTNWTNQSQTMIYPLIELMMYNMRHVQHHTAQLNLLLRQNINDAPDWVSRVGEV